MSRVMKMSIQGIRSFGPNDSDRGVIQFCSPLTLILGPNGTGKTTVIECLRYISTGDMPPGTSGGNARAAFIHDPKIAEEPSVLAQVRLQFYDVSGKLTTVTRSLKATQKDKNVTMQTLDGIITYPDATGGKTTINSKCVDLNKEMSSLLGVSKAVLENVIFCHQEDSNWPMSEGKALKEKFDNIFASSRYVKAVDSIATIRKTQAATIREYHNEVKHLKTYKDQAAEYEEDLKRQQTGRMVLLEDVEKVDEKLTPIQERLEKINSREANIWELSTKIENLKVQRTQMRKAIEELRANIENEFTGSSEELEQELEDFTGQLEKRRKQLSKLEANLDGLLLKLDDLQQEKTNLLLEQGKLEQEQKQHQDNIQSRDSMVHKRAIEHHLNGFSGRLSDDLLSQFLTLLEKKAEELKQEAKTRRAEFEEEEEELQKDIEKIRSQKTALETELKIKKDTMRKHQEDLRHLTRELTRVEASSSQQEEVAHELQRVERQLQSAQRAVDMTQLKRDVEALRSQKAELDNSLKTLEAEFRRLHAESETRLQLENLRKNKTAKSDQIRRLRNRRESDLVDLLGVMPAEGSLRTAMDEFSGRLGRQNKKDAQLQEQLRMKCAAKETEAKNLKDQITEKESEKDGFASQMKEVCENEDYDSKLTNLEQTMQETQANKGMLNGITTLFQKYLVQMGKADPSCPLCHRCFETSAEVEELKQDMQDKLVHVPTKMEQYTTELQDQQELYDRMQRLQPCKERIVELDENVIPNLKAKYESTTSQVKSIDKEIKEVSSRLQGNQEKVERLQPIHPDMVTVDRLHTEIRDLDRDIAKLQARITSTDDERTIQEVTSERDDMQAKVESVNSELDHKRQKLSDHGELLQRLQGKLNELQSRKLSIDADLQQVTQLEENKQQLSAKLQALEDEVQEAQTQLSPLSAQIEALLDQKEEKTVQKEERFDGDKEKFSKVKNHASDVEKIQKDIKRYYSSGREGLLSEVQQSLAEMERRAAGVDEKRASCQQDINSIRTDLDTQKIRERELQDNLALLRQRREVEELGERLASLQEQLGGINVKQLEKEKRQLKEEQASLEKKKATADGLVAGKDEAIREIRRKLRSDVYVDADKKYRNQMIALRTAEVANSDLEKYNKALDWTIMSYHRTKMAEINKIIRELWRNTYRGNDIDTIEILSDEDKAASGKRRQYNYRVVMVRGGVSLDMRGRCSAGQKVLASLIIRLALAETFCLNCGILALDEPTTNLDRENIESLAYALEGIIKSRQGQRNFQLIVITHDEDFVELLGRAEFVQKFTKVRKNQHGLSQLITANVADLHSR